MKKIVTIIFVLFFALLVISNINLRKSVKKEGEIMNKKDIIIEFPMRGEWFTEVSPADRVPSHGTDRFGLSYAFDFIKVDWKKSEHPTHDKNNLDYFFKGIPLESYYCFGEPLYAPFSGEVVAVENSILDGEKASWVQDQTSAIRNSLFFDYERDGFKSIAGNYIILKKEEKIYVAFCHLQKNSLKVKIGEKIQKGHLIANVGHSGNSTEPHLHFQLMDSSNIENAKGIPFVFEKYEKFNGSKWEIITNQIPASKDRIRFIKKH